MDPDTQDILADVRDADEAGEKENVFFLYVATPKKPPSALHKKVIEPFLRSKGWRKVSYRNTGFRALYFLRRRQEIPLAVEQNSNRDQSVSDIIDLVSDESDSDDGPSSSQSRNTTLRKNTQIRQQNFSQFDSQPNDDSQAIIATQKATNHRTELKKVIEDYKTQHGLTFHVHIVLSRPIDYEVDFVELASQSGSLEP
ncbi:uncharacterized protein LOC120346967 [Styela clava]|uniref:uncharacterized protein LOC120346967 n=1 Tax=Styela clava TaxID=7725 RepID=UPI00193A4198|nr:uncharacterized protein LOC120346967 [Styela clava]